MSLVAVDTVAASWAHEREGLSESDMALTNVVDGP